ncbi:hypothetical protein ON010_g7568 [Phytophthora cinnamomi]|nr:hypothetical protein ON010_g7568 [Phytophthora cinnamomi]
MDDGSETVGVEGESLTAPAAVEEDVEEEMVETVEEGCCPYLQIFKGGETRLHDHVEGYGGWPWNPGDILVRCRHLTAAGERVSMFRGAFHTGYIPQGILRLTKAQLDGACGDPRFDQDFFVDLIFADVETEGKAADTNGGETANAPKSEGVSLNEEDRQAYEDMLHRDEAFWQDIEDRKKRLQKQREEQQKKRQAEAEAKAKAEAAAAAAAEAEAKAKAEAEAEAAKKAQAAQKQNSFSIGGADEDAGFDAKEKFNRKGSWNEEKDKELMSELESLTSGALAKAAEAGVNLEEKAVDAAKSANGKDDTTDLSKEFDEMKNLEKELGLQSFSSDLASLPDGKIDPQLELLDAELKGLEGLSPKAGDTDDVMNFGADDFEELEEYLSGLSTK